MRSIIPKLFPTAALCALALSCASPWSSPEMDATATEGDVLSDAAAPDGQPTELRYVLKETLIDEETLGPEEGFLRADDNSVSIQFAVNTFSEPTTLRLIKIDHVPSPAPSKADNPKAEANKDPWLVLSRHYRIEPTSALLKKPAWISIKSPVADVPLPPSFFDLGVYQRPTSKAPWTLITMDPVQASPTSLPIENVSTSGYLNQLGEVATRLYPPYTHAPTLLQVGAQTAFTTPKGPIIAIVNTGMLTVWGRYFGWNPEVIEVQLGETVFPVQNATNTRISFFFHAPALVNEAEYPLLVRVKGKASNTLILRILPGIGTGKSTIDVIQPGKGTVAGGVVRLQGQFFGTAATRKVKLGEALLPVETDKYGQLWFRIPPDTKGGATTISVLDGVGGPPSEASPYVVYLNEPPKLTLGHEVDGIWLPPDYYYSEKAPITLLLEASNVTPNLNPKTHLYVQFTSKNHDSGWQLVDPFDNMPARCVGMPTGVCALRLPAKVAAGLVAGDLIKVRLKQTHGIYPNEIDPGMITKLVTWESAPLQVKVAGRGLIGGTIYAYVGESSQAWGDKPCNTQMQPFSVGNLLCLRSAHKCAKTCADIQQISAPGLWEGTIPFSAIPSEYGQGAGLWCVPLPKKGNFSMTNQGVGITCPIKVVLTGGLSSPPPIKFTGGDKSLTLSAGGAWLKIPADTLPKLADNQSYTIEWIAPIVDDPKNPPVQTIDPQVKTQLGSYKLSIVPEPPRLFQPVTIAMPVEPDAGKAPAIGLFDPVSTFVHSLKSTLDATGRLVSELPKGVYGAPTAAPKPGAPVVALPVKFNTAFKHIAVTYHSTKPGVLLDDKERFRVNYVVDPKSKDFAPDDYAMATLTAAVNAWKTLAGLGWKEPKGPISLSIRAKVSWAASTNTKGATTAGVFGQPQITIRTKLGMSAELPYVVAHEVGHLFQRQVTTNLTLSWLDEACAEWTAFKTVGKNFDIEGLIGDADAVRLVLAGLPKSYGGASKAHIYGSSAWIFWLAFAKKDSAVKKLYTALDWSPTLWINAYKTFETATGESISTLMRAFADDFWLHRFDPIKDLSWTSSLNMIPKQSNLALLGTKGMLTPFPARPPLSSRRWRISVNTKLAALINKGGYQFRADGLDTGEELSIWHNVKVSGDPLKPTLVARLTSKKPTYTSPTILTGVYWLIHNRWATTPGNKVNFAVILPRIHNLSPLSAKEGEQITVNGQSFGAKAGQLIVGGQSVTPLGTWKDTTLSFKLPKFAYTSAVTVRVVTADGIKSDEKMLTILKK